MEMSKEMWEAMDRIFFGSNDPEVVSAGIDQFGSTDGLAKQLSRALYAFLEACSQVESGPDGA